MKTRLFNNKNKKVEIRTTYVFKTREKDGDLHNGIDFAVPTGTTVYAPHKFKVIAKSYNSAAGNYIIIKYLNLTWKGKIAMFEHLREIPKKVVGKTYKAYTPVAHTGMSGSATGPHLHYQIQSKYPPWGSKQKGSVNPVVLDPSKYV